ncbi:MAG: hypothetical protein WD095_00590 [Candidatus Paceibacterota bacterium]
MDVKYLKPEMILRIGLGAVFVYAGISSLSSPGLWFGFIPPWIGSLIDVEIIVLAHGIIQTALGVGLLLNYLIREVSFIAFIDILLIIVFFGIDPVTFRDFGLLMMALALFIISSDNSLN